MYMVIMCIFADTHSVKKGDLPIKIRIVGNK